MATYIITGTDSTGQTADAEISINFSDLAVELLIPELTLVAGSVLGSPLSPIKIIGGKSPFVFTLTPELPAGLSFTTKGEIIGLPSESKDSTEYTISVTDVTDKTISKTFKLKVLGLPIITSLSPANGLETGNTEVSIIGQNLMTTNRVLVDGSAVSFTVVDDQTIKFITPEHAVGKISIYLATIAGEYKFEEAFEYTKAPPAITAISPNEGLDKGGYLVTLTGARFSEVSSVKFGTTEATFTVSDATTIVATVPQHVIGAVDVTATNTVGSSSPFVFTYIDSTPTYTITSDPVTGIFNEGQTITWTVTTRNVDENTMLYWQLVGQVDAADFTQGITSGSMVVNNKKASVTLSATNDLKLEGPENFTFQVRTGSQSGSIVANSAASILDTSLPPLPTITSVSPTSVWYTGGSTVSLTGANLTGTSRIIVGNTTVNFTFISGTSIRFIAPAYSLGPASIYLTTPSGTVSKTNALTYDYRIDGIPAIVPNGIDNTFTLTYYDGPKNGTVTFEDLTTFDSTTTTLDSNGYGIAHVWLKTPIGRHTIRVTFSDGHVQNYIIDVQ